MSDEIEKTPLLSKDTESGLYKASTGTFIRIIDRENELAGRSRWKLKSATGNLLSRLSGITSLIKI